MQARNGPLLGRYGKTSPMSDPPFYIKESHCGAQMAPPVDFPCSAPLPPVLILVPLHHFHNTPRIPSIVIKPTDVKILENYACKKKKLAVTNQNRPQGRSLELRRGYQNIENIFIYKRQVTRHTERRSTTLSGTPGARTKNMCKDVTAAGGGARCDRAPLRSHGWRHSVTAGAVCNITHVSCPAAR